MSRSLQEKTLSKRHAELDGFYARGYLDTWCGHVRHEWTEFLHRMFADSIPKIRKNEKDPWVLDVGCGPSISNVISASRWSSNVLMADYLESNRKEVELFWKDQPGGFSWSHYFNFVAILEILPDPKALENRTREAIKGVYFVDLTDSKRTFLVEDLPLFDVIIASLVFDVVATTSDAFISALKNISQHLKPSGLMLVQGSLNEQLYTVGSASFPVIDVDEEDMKSIFNVAEFDVLKWETNSQLTTHYFAMIQKRKVTTNQCQNM